jgi:hypothetical protein
MGKGLFKAFGITASIGMVSPLTDAQLEQTIANTITRMPLSGERAEAFICGMRKGYGSVREEGQGASGQPL